MKSTINELLFSEDKHQYSINGDILPSVTEILRPLIDYSMFSADKLERSRHLGSAVHKAIELEIKNDLDEDSVSEELIPYLSGWRRFVKESGFKPIYTEKRLHHSNLKFAGTLDLFGNIGNRCLIIDIKKMEILSPVTGIQLSAYKALLSRYIGAPMEYYDRYGLSLRKDGSYRLVPFTDETDWPAFLSLLTIHNWKLKTKHKTELNFGKEI